METTSKMKWQGIYFPSIFCMRTLARIGLMLAITINSACSPKQRSSSTQNTIVKSCSIETRTESSSWPQKLNFSVIKKHRKEPPTFTQGLQYHQGMLYESTGLYGKSYVWAKGFPTTKDNIQSVKKTLLDDRFFGEGLTLHKKKLYQLTWKSGKVFVYDPITLYKLDELSINGEGWGLTSDGNNLYVSNGSSSISLFDELFSIIKTINVQLGTRPLKMLNELEWINGCLLANIWQSSSIAIIEPSTGDVTALIDATPIIEEQQRMYKERLTANSGNPSLPPLDVLNGIAYRDDNDNLLITGKYWTTIYEIQLNARTNRSL